MDKFKKAMAYVKGWAVYLWNAFFGLSFKTKATLGVIISILAMVVLWGAPDKATVAKALPDYATSADISKATASMQRDIDNLTADLHQMRIELNAVETKLAEPAKITTGSNPAKKKRH